MEAAEGEAAAVENAEEPTQVAMAAECALVGFTCSNAHVRIRMYKRVARANVEPGSLRVSYVV